MHLPKEQNLPMISFWTPYPSSERAVNESFFLFLVFANHVHHSFQLKPGQSAFHSVPRTLVSKAPDSVEQHQLLPALGHGSPLTLSPKCLPLLAPFVSLALLILA
jgi:hypothetical protein